MTVLDRLAADRTGLSSLALACCVAAAVWPAPATAADDVLVRFRPE